MRTSVCLRYYRSIVGNSVLPIGTGIGTFFGTGTGTDRYFFSCPIGTFDFSVLLQYFLNGFFTPQFGKFAACIFGQFCIIALRFFFLGEGGCGAECMSRD